MTIPAETRIGPFAILELIGSGGMGAVYRAHDARLRRDVAIKVLAPAFAGDPDRLHRFEQEALAVARLVHPNILSIHDVGRHDGAPYMVTELLEGETLADKIKGRPLSVPKAVEYARQIARGLAAAHASGIVHRDIKPANLFISRDGGVKILDFGVAKLREVNVGTATTAATETVHDLGPIGTAAYMSPEQARGSAVDARSDLFSLGVVLHEMLSGVSPFRRDTNAETMTAVLREDVPPLPPSAQRCPSLMRVLRHCLEKDPAERFQTARDLLFALDGVEEVPSDVTARPPRSIKSRLAVLALAAALGIAGFLLGRQTMAPAAVAEAGTIHRLTDFGGIEDAPAIAPDHKSVAFTAR
ncbi:MAG TPA: serine/threonine-protein kinase, partial [Vicinamibacterales bacterium]|nr:serine/threonine-protein kinase [Vicinamibacterales bacterium]